MAEHLRHCPRHHPALTFVEMGQRGSPGRRSTRWLAEGFIAGEQDIPGRPWRVRVDADMRARVVPEIPEGWVGLTDAAKAMGIARQTVLDRVRRGEIEAVHVDRGRRSGLAIRVPGPAHALSPTENDATTATSSHPVQRRQRSPTFLQSTSQD